MVETNLQWIINAGLAQKVNWNAGNGMPISIFDDLAIFKIYLLDVGFLTTSAGVEPLIIVQKKTLFIEFCGRLAKKLCITIFIINLSTIL
ncbi:hypothetical protein [Lactococcus allomyrinae]|nr:hypothetical protein [Lactococcus allomyrinae]